MQLKEEKPVIIKNEGKLTIKAFGCRKGHTKEVIIDLTPYTGEYIRIWIDDDLSFSIDKHKDHYWQVAELQVPVREYKNIGTGKVDEQGLPITISEPIPIKLPTIRLFDIEGEEK